MSAKANPISTLTTDRNGDPPEHDVAWIAFRIEGRAFFSIRIVILDPTHETWVADHFAHHALWIRYLVDPKDMIAPATAQGASTTAEKAVDAIHIHFVRRGWRA